MIYTKIHKKSENNCSHKGEAVWLVLKFYLLKTSLYSGVPILTALQKDPFVHLAVSSHPHQPESHQSKLPGSKFTSKKLFKALIPYARTIINRCNTHPAKPQNETETQKKINGKLIVKTESKHAGHIFVHSHTYRCWHWPWSFEEKLVHVASPSFHLWVYQVSCRQAPAQR